MGYTTIKALSKHDFFELKPGVHIRKESILSLTHGPVGTMSKSFPMYGGYWTDLRKWEKNKNQAPKFVSYMLEVTTSELIEGESGSYSRNIFLFDEDALRLLSELEVKPVDEDLVETYKKKSIECYLELSPYHQNFNPGD